MDTTMDNPQATLTTEDLAWLGGVIDGEGCITLARRYRKSGAVNMIPNVKINNSDPVFIEECSRILKAANIGHWVVWKKPKGNRPTRRMMGEISIHGFKRVDHALEILAPHIRSKHTQATTLLEFVRRRLAIGSSAKFSYTEVDDDYHSRMAQLKQREAPETIRGSRVFGKI